ncbi:MAG: histidinol dehydrogenase [Treponema sp.]|nr:histidinol dehydrogenase [Treponema sp.]
MGIAKVLKAREFKEGAQSFLEGKAPLDGDLNKEVTNIIAAVRSLGDQALWHYTRAFEKSIPHNFEVPLEAAREAWERLSREDPDLAGALDLSARQLRIFARLQREQYRDFEAELSPGIFAGQRVIPVERAAIYAPGGRFPLISSALMALIPALEAGVKDRYLVSPPQEGGLPDWRILAAAHLGSATRIFALGGAQAVAAFALGTDGIPKADLIAGPGNKYVAEAKRILFGEVGIDLLAGPTDVLIIWEAGEGPSIEGDAALAAADMIAQAEHDLDARARALVPDEAHAAALERALEAALVRLPDPAIARGSLEAGGLIIIYDSKEEAAELANLIAPEHLEVMTPRPGEWLEGPGALRNYGSLFLGRAAAEVLGDYSAGINHILPTSASARFTGGLSVRQFLKTPTTLRCEEGEAYQGALRAAEIIARAEGLGGHAASAALRKV